MGRIKNKDSLSGESLNILEELVLLVLSSWHMEASRRAFSVMTTITQVTVSFVWIPNLGQISLGHSLNVFFA